VAVARGGKAEAPLAQPAEPARQHGLAALQQIRPQLVDHHEGDQAQELGTELLGRQREGREGERGWSMSGALR